MHEARLCLSLIHLAEEALQREHGVAIAGLELEVGQLSGVAPEALLRAFPICATGTAAEGAELRWRSVPGRDLVLKTMEVS